MQRAHVHISVKLAFETRVETPVRVHFLIRVDTHSFRYIEIDSALVAEPGSLAHRCRS